MPSQPTHLIYDLKQSVTTHHSIQCISNYMQPKMAESSWNLGEILYGLVVVLYFLAGGIMFLFMMRRFYCKDIILRHFICVAGVIRDRRGLRR